MDAKRPQFAQPQSGKHRRRPYRPVALGDIGNERFGFIGRGIAFAAPAYSGKLETGARVDRELATRDGPSKDRPQRQEGDLDAGRAEPSGEELVGEVLEIGAREVGEPDRAQFGEDMAAHSARVPAERGWLEAVARAVADRAGLSALFPRLPSLANGRRLRCPQTASSRESRRVSPP